MIRVVHLRVTKQHDREYAPEKGRYPSIRAITCMTKQPAFPEQMHLPMEWKD